MKRIAFVWNYDVQPIHLLYWWDGLRSALDKLREHYQVDIFTVPNPADTFQALVDYKPDAVMVWGGIDTPLCTVIKAIGPNIPTAFLYAGGPKDQENFKNFDHVFYESECDGDEFRKLGYSTSRAFGTNTELFQIQRQPKVFDAIYPATFAKWKRHDLFAAALKGRPAIACGFWQEVEQECRTVCEDNGIVTLKAVHPEVLVGLYNASKATVLTADANGGCQRAVLESLACGIPVVITNDNKKCDFNMEGVFVSTPHPDHIQLSLEHAHDPRISRQQMRDWVVENYSETVYMNQLKTWLDKQFS